MLNFKQLKQQVGLERVLGHYGLLDGLERKGKSLRGVCPFCEASVDGPFSASLEKNAFQCFACKASGNLFDFVARFEGIDISKGIRPAAAFVERTFTPKPERPVESIKEVDQATARMEDRKGSLNPPLTFALKGIDPTHRCIEKVGIRAETAAQFGAGVFTGKGMFKNHFVIPILNPEGQLIAYNGVPIEGEPNPLYPPKFDKEDALFNLNATSIEDCHDDTGLILVRDPLQVMVLAEQGFPRSIGFRGDVFSEEQLRQLLYVYGAGQKITLFCAKEDEQTVSNLARLIPLFFVRLVRYERQDTLPAGFAADELKDLLSIP